MAPEQGTGGVLRQEEPVAAPGDVAGDDAETLDLDANVLEMPVAIDVVDDRVISVDQFDADHADRRLEAMAPRSDATEMRQRRRGADRPVAAHAEKADVVEEDQTGGASRILRLAQQRADQRVEAARLVDDESPDMIEFLGEALTPLGERAAAERRPAVDDEPRRLALGVGIDDAHWPQPSAPRQAAHHALNSANCVSAKRFWLTLKASDSLKCSAYSPSPCSVMRCLK